MVSGWPSPARRRTCRAAQWRTRVVVSSLVLRRIRTGPRRNDRNVVCQEIVVKRTVRSSSARPSFARHRDVPRRGGGSMRAVRLTRAHARDRPTGRPSLPLRRDGTYPHVAPRLSLPARVSLRRQLMCSEITNRAQIPQQLQVWFMSTRKGGYVRSGARWRVRSATARRRRGFAHRGEGKWSSGGT